MFFIGILYDFLVLGKHDYFLFIFKGDQSYYYTFFDRTDRESTDRKTAIERGTECG
jgi:hypothetical protein